MVSMGAASRRFHVRADTGTKPYSKTRLKVYAQPGAHLHVSHTQFLYGCWFGRDSPTDKHTVESKAGVFRARAVRRSTEDRSWSADAVIGTEWTLWRTAETTRGRPPRAAMTTNEPVWNAPLSTTPRAHGDPPSETCWRRFERQIRSCENLARCAGGHLRARRTRALRINLERTIQRRQTQEAHRRHWLAFRHHPLLLRHPHLQSMCLERKHQWDQQRRGHGARRWEMRRLESRRKLLCRRDHVPLEMRWTTSTWLQQSWRSRKMARSHIWIGRP